ncbi:MAG: TRAP transporter small permease [Proteobacteria bacterium]|nr:TRAP transporter small permease [Pseudomonadota bacterium]
MIRLENWLTKCEEVLMTVATIIMVLMVFIQIICRYVLEISLQGTEELARYLMITGTFLGAAIAVKAGVHIQVELRHLFRLTTETMRVWDMIVNVVAMAALCLMCYYVYLALPTWSDRSTALNIPMVFPMGAVFTGILLMIIHYIFLIYRNVEKMLGKE